MYYTLHTIYRSSRVVGCVECFEMSRKSVRTHLYNNFRARYSGFSVSNYSEPSQIKIREKNLIHRYLSIHNQFSWSRFLKIPTFICNAQFHSLSLFYLDCLFEFGLGKTVEKCVDFVDYLVIWYESTTMEMLLQGLKWPNMPWDKIWCVRWMRWKFNIDVFEVFLHQLLSMVTHIIQL